ncbi:MAG: TIGR03668 family PPOX class F420-dependent oxidoreductase [Acidimicrobiia bacterium]
MAGHMDVDQALARVDSAGLGRLATVTPSGAPHLVPVMLAVCDKRLVSAIDHKPKGTQRLARLRNIAHEPRVAVLLDHYEDDWSRLWWMRVDGLATIVEGGLRHEQAVQALVARHPQYRDRPPIGPAIIIEVVLVTAWQAVG